MTAIAWAMIWIATVYFKDYPPVENRNLLGVSICFIFMVALTIKDLMK